jgi:flagellar protein FlgJ
VTIAIQRTGYVKPEVEDFMTKIRPAALDVEASTGIPWRFAATQAAHESRYGLSKLTVEANNLFGITGDTWAAEGKPVYVIITKEFAKDNTPFEIKRPFRKYASWTESLRDWSALIQKPRYAKALAAAKAGDFVAFARGLQEGGYATDPRYAVQLVLLHNELDGIG